MQVFKYVCIGCGQWGPCVLFSKLGICPGRCPEGRMEEGEDWEEYEVDIEEEEFKKMLQPPE